MFNSVLDALYACRNHWQWLWITGSDYKRSYEPATHWDSWCACCEYRISCKNCPLVGYAWFIHCISSKNSFYRKWFKARTKKTRIKYAYKMVQSCNRAIENILIKG